jgi:hypothetical protein
MRARSLGSLAVWLVMLPSILIAQPQHPGPTPPRDKPVAEIPTGTGRIRGRVVAADGTTPLRRAQVRALAGAIRTTRLTSTDADGRYEFADLPAGRYEVMVDKAGYVGLAFGQKRPFDGGRPLDVGDAQLVDGVDFALPRGSVIAGRLTDHTGEPIVGAYVQAMRYQYQPGGRRRLVAASSRGFFSNSTNDLGEFRLFGLMPGTYVVSASATSIGVVNLTTPESGTGGVAGIDSREGYIQTHFPGTANLAEAQSVTVGLGEETEASFSVAIGRMSKLSGTVRRSDGRPPATGLQVHLRPSDESGTGLGGFGGSGIAPDGSFTFANVPPGGHVLEVAPFRPMYAAEAGGAEQEYGRVDINVGGGDITGLAIVTRPSATAAGRLIVPNHMPKGPEGSRLRVIAMPSDPSRGLNISFLPNNGVVGEGGRFETRGLIGQVLFRPQGLPSGFVLKSVSINGVDITDVPYDSTNGDAAGLEVTVAEQAQITGIVRNARGETVTDYKVALFPAGAKPSMLTARFLRVATADPKGRFHLEGLPAGEYVGLAVESFEQGEEWDPAFQKRALPSARRIVVREGETLAVELPFLE